VTENINSYSDENRKISVTFTVATEAKDEQNKWNNNSDRKNQQDAAM